MVVQMKKTGAKLSAMSVLLILLTITAGVVSLRAQQLDGHERCQSTWTWEPSATHPGPPASDSEHYESLDRMWKEWQTRVGITKVLTAAALYCTLEGTYPSTLRELEEFSGQLRGRALCVFDAGLYRDGWGNPVYYAVHEEKVRVASAGPDGRFTTEDDIVNPSRGGPNVREIDVESHCAP